MAATTTKKRAAKSQSGPAPKKVKKTDTATGKLDTNTTKKAKRSIPVTLTTSPPNDSENTDDEDDWEDAEDDVDFDGQAVDDDNAMQVDSGEGKTSARESHIAQKVLQQSRKAAKPHSDLISEAKRVWALARSQSISASERKKHITDLMNVVRGKVKLIVFKHDASRIIQTLVKYGGKAEREEVCEELKGSYADSAKNRYAKFLLLKLIRLLPSHRTDILSSFHGHVLSRSRLLLHREASGVLADAFELYANGAQRAELVKEFYGKEVALFSQKQDQDDKGKSSKGLIGVLETIGSDKEKKARVLAAVKENLISIFNNPDKGAVRHAIVHCATWEYLDVLGRMQDSEGEDAAKEAEKLRRDLFENCAELLPEMVHTKDGSRVVREFLARGSAKDRKTILKTLKPHIERMCLDDEAQMVLFTAFDVIDDTKLLQKSVASIITTPNTLNTLVKSPQGRRAIIYLLIPRSRRYFTIAQIRALRDTDNARDGVGSTKQGNGEGAMTTGDGTSKKSPEVRQEEVRRGASEALLSWVEEQGAELAREAAESLIIADIMLHAEGDKSSASQALLRGLTTQYPASSTSSASSPSSLSTPVHPLDLPHTSRLYKNLLQGGHFNHSLRTVEISPRWDSTTFAVEFVKIVGGDDGAVIKDMCTKGERNGSFVVAQLCEALVREDASSTQEVKDSREKLKRWLSTSETLKAIEEGEKDGAKGTKVLLDGIGKL
ncbi:puf family rna-binding protein [Lentinula edodes]|uniref:Puf family rna-binding protein n=1 Tax=Lentinula edodes TaxID=5353 RepID=A0A1Q3E9M9_LENED|nr:puf family rna-binding protein [Lentinula edodes]